MAAPPMLSGGFRAHPAKITNDDLYRLTSETITLHPGGHNGIVAYSFYDAEGNRKTMTLTVAGISGGSIGKIRPDGAGSPMKH